MRKEGANKMTLEQTLQAIYDSEINIKIEWCWDGGFDLTVGPTGVTGKRENVMLVSEIAEALREMVLKYVPKSLYARNDWQSRWEKALRSLAPEEYERWVEGFIEESGCPTDLVEEIRAIEGLSRRITE